MFKKFGFIALFIVVTGFSGWVVGAQNKPAAGPTVTRTVLNQQDLAVPGYAAALVRVQLPVGSREGRHHHPGTLIAVVADGTMTLEVEGKVSTYKTGETFAVPPNTVHEGMNKSSAPITLIASFVFPKDKPMTIQEK
jgi:quercetin dioxygenase-like cupin family protein